MSVVAAIAVPHPPLIIHEVGRGREQEISKTIDSYDKAMKFVASLKPETVIVATPHADSYADYVHVSAESEASGSFANFGAPEVFIKASYDTELVKCMCEEFDAESLSAGTLGGRNAELDHATLTPLYFLNKYLDDYKLVRIGISSLGIAEHYAIGRGIKKAALKLGRRVVFIASGDLSHKLKDDGPYGFAAEGPVFDESITHAFADGDFLSIMNISPDICEKAAECGHRPFVMMAGALDKTAVKSSLLSYEGPFGVGYAVATFECTGEDESRDFYERFNQLEKARLESLHEQEDGCVKLARKALEYYIQNGEKLKNPEDTDEKLLKEKAAVFVCIKKFGRLRGCIGTLSPLTDSLAEEIVRNAISAGVNDSRFPPVEAKELPYLSYSVDILTTPEDVDSIDKLDAKRYGVIVSSGYKRGVLLPDLEGVNTPQEQIAICRKKGSIADDEEVRVQRFEVIRHQ